MGWGETHELGTGTTGQIEAAHDAMDRAGIPRGNLAERALTATRLLTTYEANVMSTVEAIEACYPEPNAILRAEAHRTEGR